MTITKYIAVLFISLYSSAPAHAQEENYYTAVPPISADSIIRLYIDAIGGEAAIKKIKDIKIVRTAVIQQIPITITEIKKQPDRLKIMVEGINMVLQKVVVNKDRGYQENEGNRAELSPVEVTGTKAEADLLSKLHPEQYGITRVLKGVQQIDTFSTYLIEETDLSGKTVQYYYHIRTGLLLRKASNEMTPQGPTPTITSYRTYKEVPESGGYKIPWAVRQEVGMQVVNSSVESVEVNKNIPDKEFE